jgi:hypothetical protein
MSALVIRCIIGELKTNGSETSISIIRVNFNYLMMETEVVSEMFSFTSVMTWVNAWNFSALICLESLKSYRSVLSITHTVFYSENIYDIQFSDKI